MVFSGVVTDVDTNDEFAAATNTHNDFMVCVVTIILAHKRKPELLPGSI